MKKCISPEDIGLNSKDAAKISEGLNVYLADLNVLYLKLHNFHWNVVGIGFYDMHEVTQEMYEAVAEKLDRVAETILQLGSKPVASMQDSLKLTNIREAPSKDINSVTIANILINDFKTITKHIREVASFAGEANDEWTVTFLGEDIGFFQKHIWMLCSYINR